MFLADIDGNVLVNPEYSSPIEFSEGLAPVLNDNKKVGFIDKTGAVVVEFIYDWAAPFHDGLTAVGNKGYFYFINADRKVISGPFEDFGSEVYTYMTAYTEYSEGYTAFF